MKYLIVILILLAVAVIVTYVNGKNKSTSVKYSEGGLYYTVAEKGGYSILKILKIDENGYHIRLYSNVWDNPPNKVDEKLLYMAGVNHKPNESLGMGHVPISKLNFNSWNAIFVQESTVQSEELEGYNMWLEAKGGYF